jgi:hypothetical protein
MRRKNRSDFPRFLPELMERRLLLSSVAVNTVADETDAPGSQTVSLRDAITTADTAGTPTTITFDPTVFVAQQTIVLSYDLEITAGANVTIIGPGSGLTIGGAGSETDLLTVDAGATANITQLSFSNGDNLTSGGAILNNGTLSLTDCTLTQNTSGNPTTPSQPGNGGAIDNTAALTMTNCTVAGNSVYNSLNTAGEGEGGGLLNTGTATLVNDTFSTNGATAGGGIFNAGTLSMANTIVAGNSAATGPDVQGSIISTGYNLIGQTDASTGWISTDQTGTTASPLAADLGSLANNGGPALTMLPSSSSPAIQHGSVALVPAGITTDERGLPRTINGNVDIGAVEVQGASAGLISTSISLQSSAGASGSASSVTLTATVTPSSAGVPTGSVIFTNGSTPLGTATLDSTGTAILTVDSLPIGTDSVTANYSGDTTFQSSTSAPLLVTVNATGTAPATVSLQASSGSITAGMPLTLTAAVSSTGSGTPTGTVTFNQNGTTLGSAAVTTSGLESISVTTLPAGADTITATYSGDSNFQSAISTPIEVVVTGTTATASLSLNASSNSIAAGAPLTLTATLTPSGSGTPTGSVSFSLGDALLGTAAVATSGIESITVAALPAGTDAIIASYSGDTVFAASSSAEVDVVVAATADGFSPAVTKSSLPAHIIAGVKFSSTLLVSLTNSLTINESGNYTVSIIASPTTTLNTANDYLLKTTQSKTGKVAPGKSIRLSDPLTLVPTDVPAGTYYLLLQTTDSAGNMVAVNTGLTADIEAQSVALVESFTKVTLPTTTGVAGQPVHATARVLITNNGNVPSRGPTKIVLSAADATTGQDTGNPITTLTRTLSIRPGASVTVLVPITEYPTVPAAAYNLQVQVTDPFASNVSLAFSQTAFNIAEPFVQLSATFPKITAANIKLGTTLTITNTGNVDDLTKFTAVVGFATDAAGQNIIATGTGIVSTHPLRIRAGKTAKLAVSGWKALLAGVPAGSYYLTVTLTDATGDSALAVSGLVVVKPQ